MFKWINRFYFSFKSIRRKLWVTPSDLLILKTSCKVNLAIDINEINQFCRSIKQYQNKHKKFVNEYNNFKNEILSYIKKFDIEKIVVENILDKQESYNKKMENGIAGCIDHLKTHHEKILSIENANAEINAKIEIINESYARANKLHQSLVRLNDLQDQISSTISRGNNDIECGIAKINEKANLHSKAIEIQTTAHIATMKGILRSRGLE